MLSNTGRIIKVEDSESVYPHDEKKTQVIHFVLTYVS